MAAILSGNHHLVMNGLKRDYRGFEMTIGTLLPCTTHQKTEKNMNARPLSVQSYCFREFPDNVETANLVKEIGLTGIELWNGHADFNDPTVYDAVCDAYSNAGVHIVSTGVNLIVGDETKDRPLFEFAKRAGTSAMSVNFSLNTLDKAIPMAETLSEEFGIPLGIHNHGGGHWLGNAEALRWVFGKSSTRI